jgi:hypothetical protein
MPATKRTPAKKTAAARAAAVAVTPDPALLVDDVDADEVETPEVDEDFNLDEWISGISPTVRAVKIYQRHDLFARLDELETELRVTKAIPADDRGANDPTPESVEAEMDEVLKVIDESGVWFKIKGLSDDARDAIKDRLKKRGVKDDLTVALHELAAAVVSPPGVTATHLRTIGEANEVQLKMLMATFGFACTQPPRVTAPLSRSSSAERSTRAR